MLQHPNCKLNIGLRVVGKRADGYHNIETLFYPVHALHDELEIEPSDVFSFVQEGISVDCPPEKNLIVRCYQQMRARYPQIGNVKIRFRKHIPFGAGLGGGSSDAAHTALALNELYRLGLSQSALAQEVSSLGADCPFFYIQHTLLCGRYRGANNPYEFLFTRYAISVIQARFRGINTRSVHGHHTTPRTLRRDAAGIAFQQAYKGYT